MVNGDSNVKRRPRNLRRLIMAHDDSTSKSRSRNGCYSRIQPYYLCAIVIVTVLVVLKFHHPGFYINHLRLASTTKIDDNSRIENGALVEKDARDDRLLPVQETMNVVPDQCQSPSRGDFDRIYKGGGWRRVKLRPAQDFYGNAKLPPSTPKKSASGRGSDIGEPTVNSLAIIRQTIVKFNLTTMIDIPCGDVNWILDSFETDMLSLYVGLDVVSDLIKENNLRFKHHNNKRFYYWDGTECVLPKIQTGNSEHEARSFDLVHVRDVIQHLPLEMGVKFFCNVFKSGPKYMLTTTFRNVKKNGGEIVEGSFYRNNLALEPFSFPTTDSDCVLTHPKMEPDSTCFYDLSQPWVKDFIHKQC